VLATVDSGATRNFINETLLRQLKAVPVREVYTGIRLADGTSVRREFLDFFLPPHYFRRLEDDIRARYQREGEGFKDYSIGIRTLMRHAGYDQMKELDRIYENCLPTYQMY